MDDKALALLILLPVFALEIILLPKLNHKHGFVITTRGDTIACMIKGYADPAEVQYKPEKDSVYHVADVEKIKEFRLTRNHEVYRAIIVPGGFTPRYMQLLDSGKINLYVYHERIGKASYPHLFAVKDNQPVIKIFGHNTLGDNKTALLQLIAGNAQTIDYLNAQNDYNYKRVINTIKLYNGEVLNGN